MTDSFSFVAQATVFVEHDVQEISFEILTRFVQSNFVSGVISAIKMEGGKTLDNAGTKYSITPGVLCCKKTR